MKKVKKKWGSEQWIVNEPEYCGKLMEIFPGHSCSIHFHKNKKETFYILSGSLLLKLWNTCKGRYKSTVLTKGQALTIKTLVPHTFTNDTDSSCVFIEFSSHHEDIDSYRLTQSY